MISRKLRSTLVKHQHRHKSHHHLITVRFSLLASSFGGISGTNYYGYLALNSYWFLARYPIFFYFVSSFVEFAFGLNLCKKPGNLRMARTLLVVCDFFFFFQRMTCSQRVTMGWAQHANNNVT